MRESRPFIEYSIHCEAVSISTAIRYNNDIFQVNLARTFDWYIIFLDKIEFLLIFSIRVEKIFILIFLIILKIFKYDSYLEV